ncbi:MAG TPA: fused MFS/spermidine synthase, partial [Terriglobales bacterium]|nr:fused MFS/spermidine synthase [Terriglobales bacterium]
WTRRRKLDWYVITLASAIILLGCGLYLQLASQEGRLLYRARNFYGALTVSRTWDNDMLHSRVELMHGRIVHGVQLEQNRKLATTYYGEKSGAGLAITMSPRRSAGNMRVGVIGLGTGTLATYARSGDTYRFYEINPMVVRLAQGERSYFSFLKDSAGRIEIASGDARLLLEAEARRGEYENFDVLLVDAFNGDSIPIHLLTREAMKVYLAHLRGPDSVIAIHISNIAVDLAPPILGLAHLYGLKSTVVTTTVTAGATVSSKWVLLTRGTALDVPAIRQASEPVLASTDSGTEVWSDNYSNLLSLFNYRVFLIRSL